MQLAGTGDHVVVSRDPAVHDLGRASRVHLLERARRQELHIGADLVHQRNRAGRGFGQARLVDDERRIEVTGTGQQQRPERVQRVRRDDVGMAIDNHHVTP
jgi:hypothetical protein